MLPAMVMVVVERVHVNDYFLPFPFCVKNFITLIRSSKISLKS
jgi:hypothetical protein